MKLNHPLVHRLNTDLKRRDCPVSGHWLVAVSGGADSVALFHLSRSLGKMLGFQVSLAHVHHGPADTATQTAFRDQAREFCRKLADSFEVEFLTNAEAPDVVLTSEGDFRNFRWGQLQQWRQKKAETCTVPVIIAVAHNREDALETRLIQLIRGAGAKGLEGMKYFDSHKIRPLLETSRQEILEFLEQQNLPWLEDPSNANVEPLRNWLRRQWLPDLEAHRAGSVESLGRSLEILSRTLSDTSSHLPMERLFIQQALRRDVFLQLSGNQKRQAVALYLSRQGVEGFTSGHVEEILKRLDTHRKEHSFRMLSVEWQISREEIQASRV